MNINQTIIIELNNLCPNQRTITRPLLFVHNYSVFLFGSILNLLAFFVLIQNSLRCHSTFVYLAFLSLSNGILSFVRFIQWFITFYFHIQMESYLSTCRLFRFILDLLTHFSLLTLVCVNIDRVRTVNQKFFKSIFSQIFIRELIIGLILCSYHFHWLIKYGYKINSNEIICNVDHDRTPFYFYFLQIIYPRIEFLIFFCLPLLINTLCTIIIIRSLCMRMETVKRFNSLNNNNRIIKKKIDQKHLQNIFLCCYSQRNHLCLCCQFHCRCHREIHFKFSCTEQNVIKYDNENSSIDQRSLSIKNHLSQDNQQMTSMILNKIQRTRRIRDIHLSAMLIGLNIVYFIFNLPFNLHQTFAHFWYRNQTDDECMMKFIQLLVDIIQQTYFSTNFFLYVLTNRRFREEFYNIIIKLFTGKTHRQKQTGSLSMNPSTGMILNFNVECQTTSLNNRANHISIIE